jgi:hypothetical protein
MLRVRYQTGQEDFHRSFVLTLTKANTNQRVTTHDMQEGIN